MEVHDVIYGTIQIPSPVAQIISLDIFQRLRDISQLGSLAFVLAEANHSRFDHCIGTYVKARQMLDSLEASCSYLLSDEEWLNCYRIAVEVAALLHDIGHGPFSHVWEKIVEKYQHEINSIVCVDAIFNKLPQELFPGLRRSQNHGVQLVKALIIGDGMGLSQQIPQKFGFIFEIVNNKRCKVDVDKWDYLNRDCFYLRPDVKPPSSIIDSIFLNARVSVDGSRIEYDYRDFHKIYALFELRYRNHLDFYQSPISLALDEILIRIIHRSDATICDFKLKDITSHNTSAFILLTQQNVLRLIKNDPDFKYVIDPSNLKVVKESELTQNGHHSAEDSSFLTIQVSMEGPGQTMPLIDEFRLYGDENEMLCINRNLEKVMKKYYFCRT